MKTLILVLVSLAYCAASPVSSNGKAAKLRMFAEIADNVNSGQKGWVASTNHELTYQIHKTWSYATCDNTRSPDFQIQPLSAEEEKEADKLPKEFDAREHWPKCESIGHIRDQSWCGSCWAFGSVEAMTDRICIASNGKKNLHLSAAHLAGCDKANNNCHGGDMQKAYEYYQNEGIVTGGDWNANDGCWPYPYSCVEGRKNATSCPADSEGHLPNIQCLNECPNKAYEEHKFGDDKHFGQKAYTLGDEKKIMLDIYKNGPVTAGIKVFRDFMSYKGGLYEPQSTDVAGHHAIKILGWGEEDGKKYWLIANSWTKSWGMDGFAKFKKGTCDIEDYVVASLPKLK
jgi:cathepsin B